MSFVNHIAENDLKGYIPEISKLLWADETDYSRQKSEAVKHVIQDLQDRGFKARDLMPELVLRTSGTVISAAETGEASAEDVIGRLRFVYTVTGFTTGAKSIVLEGSNDKETWYTVTTVAISANVSSSVIIESQYMYYRVTASVSAGEMDYRAYLVETTFDRLISFKWLELILLDRYTEEGDLYHSKMEYFQKAYNNLWSTITIWRDTDSDGNVTASEKATTNSFKMLK